MQKRVARRPSYGTVVTIALAAVAFAAAVGHILTAPRFPADHGLRAMESSDVAELYDWACVIEVFRDWGPTREGFELTPLDGIHGSFTVRTANGKFPGSVADGSFTYWHGWPPEFNGAGPRVTCPSG